jgi:hypothetical protein
VAAGFAMAAGSGILANSRAYEGFLLCAPVAVVLALAIVRSGRATQHLSAMAAPAGLLAACMVFLGYYNFRAFGDPLMLPYKLNRAEYAAVPVFLWQKPYPVPQYRHPVMRDFYLKWERRVFVQARSFPGLLAAIAQKIAGGTLFFIGLALMPLLVFLPRALSDRRVRPAVLLVVIGAVGIAPNPWFMPHYFAPYTGAIYLLLLQAMRHMRYWQPSGKALVHITPFLCLALFFLRLFAAPLHLGMSRYPMAWFGSEPVGLERASVARHLAALPGKQLALVRYEPRHITFDEWVYNAADIDGAKVVWARETDDSSDRELLNYFTERQAWLVEPDFTPPRITPLRR